MAFNSLYSVAKDDDILRLGSLLSNPTRVALVRAAAKKSGCTHAQLRDLIGLSMDRYGIHLTWLVKTKLIVKSRNDDGEDVFSVDQDEAIQIIIRISDVLGLHASRG